jgi:hypothetical protein
MGPACENRVVCGTGSQSSSLLKPRLLSRTASRLTAVSSRALQALFRTVRQRTTSRCVRHPRNPVGTCSRSACHRVPRAAQALDACTSLLAGHGGGGPDAVVLEEPLSVIVFLSDGGNNGPDDIDGAVQRMTQAAGTAT